MFNVLFVLDLLYKATHLTVINISIQKSYNVLFAKKLQH